MRLACRQMPGGEDWQRLHGGGMSARDLETLRPRRKGETLHWELLGRAQKENERDITHQPFLSSWLVSSLYLSFHFFYSYLPQMLLFAC